MAKSLDRLGIPASIVKRADAVLSGSSTVTVVCACGAEVDIKVSSLLRTIRRVGHYRCLSCSMKAKHQDNTYREKVRAGTSESWSSERRVNQSKISKSLWMDDDFRRRVTDSSKRAWDDEGRRHEASERSAALWATSEYRHKCELAYSSPEARKARSKFVRSLWLRPEYVSRQKAIKSSSEHVELQRQLALRRFESPEYRKHISDSLLAYWDSSPELKSEMSARMVALWNNPDYRDRQARAAADPELSALKSKNAKAQWQRPEVRKAIIDGVKKVWDDPDYRARAAEISRRKWQDDGFRERQAKARASMLSNGRDSILERTTQLLLSALKIPYVRHHVIGYFEFDLFIPSHGVLVECNGEYWHSLRRDKDAAKFTYVDTYFPELRVLYLWERDFLNPNLIRQKLVRALFGERHTVEERSVDFSFKDLRICKMDMSQKSDKSYYSAAEEFLQSFHYAGFGRSAKVVYGLYLNGVLVAVCKFCPPIRKESATSMGFSVSQVLELDRFCIHPDFQKKNMASWFISRCSKKIFETYPAVSTLISFADSTFGHTGTIYKAANWKQVRVVPPDYHYVSPDGFVIHKKTLYDHASRNGSKEAEYAVKFGYVKVTGKSKTKFRFDR